MKERLVICNEEDTDGICLSVRLSHAGTLSKRLMLSSKLSHLHLVPSLYFSQKLNERPCEIPTTVRNIGGV